jgi:hypothetical protein
VITNTHLRVKNWILAYKNTDRWYRYSVPKNQTLRSLESSTILLKTAITRHSLNQQISLFAPLRPQMPLPNAIGRRHIEFPVRTYVLYVVLPIVFGSAIYLVFRDSNILIFRLFDALGISLPNRITTGSIANPILCSLPDGMWVFAFASWMRLIWGRHWFWCNLPVSLALGSEIGQLFQIVPGTFDLLDVLFYSIGHVLSQRSSHE